jgi:hypothetical protein
LIEYSGFRKVFRKRTPINIQPLINSLLRPAERDLPRFKIDTVEDDDEIKEEGVEVGLSPLPLPPTLSSVSPAICVFHILEHM